jgi:predicted nucleotidyltransferase
MEAHPDIPPAQWAHILSELREIESREDVRILFAIESGSRAWGFASPDSDFDVRFIYVRRPDWYLSLLPGRDVIELPLVGDDDINGWDIRKALNLALKPNPVLLEWLSSPIQYIWQSDLCSDIQTFTKTMTQSSACRHHYMRMADLQRGEGDQIKLKRYFYALRAAMALRWIETRDDLPPMNFYSLMAGVEIPRDVTAEIKRLLDIKTSTAELGTGERIPVLENFLDQQIQWAKAQTERRLDPETRSANRQAANALFRGILRGAWI